MKKIQMAIIGAGSAQFSGGLIRDLCVTPGLHGSTVMLMDIHADRLDFIGKMARKLSDELGAQLEIRTTLSREEALTGADFVINTAQDQCHEWAEAQRTLAEKHGYYRGAHLHALGQMAFMLDVARDMERICPDAWLIQSSNPVFEGCTLMTRETKIKVIGLCHGHYGYRDIARVLGLDPKDVTAKATGFNHWIWLTDFRYKGEDAYPLIDRWIEEQSEEYWKADRRYADQQMSRAAIHQYHLYGLMPIGDTPRMCDYPRVMGWWYNGSLELKKKYFSQQGGFDSEIGWQQYLDDLNDNLAKVREAAERPDRKVSEFFPPVRSDEQIVPIINALVHDERGIYQVNVPNTFGQLPGFPADIVVECEAEVSGAGVRPIGANRLPSRVMAGAMYPRYAEAEMMVEAVRTGKYEAFKLALLTDHRSQSEEQVDALLKEWINDPRNRYIRERMGLREGEVL